MAAAIQTSELRAEIIKILDGGDLNSLSAKKVRNKLEELFKVDLTSRKKEIDDLMMSVINNEEEDENGASSEEESPAAKKPKAKASKKEKKTTKSRESDSDDDDNKEVDDEAYARQLQEEDKRPMRRAASRNVPSGKRKDPKQKKEKSLKKDGTPKAETPYSRKCELSAELAEVMGEPQMARSDVVKRMWALAKERELFDPNDKRYVICDEQFLKVFGLKRVLMFGMMKYIKNHMFDPQKKD